MDRILITMPTDLYQFMQALAVIQDYQLQVCVGAQRKLRDMNYQVTIRMDEKFSYLEPCLRVTKELIPVIDYSGWDEEQRGEFDCFIKLDDAAFKRARELCIVTQLNITAGLNTLIGAGAGCCPVLNALQLPQEERIKDGPTVLLLEWDERQTQYMYEFILNNHPNLSIIVDPRDLNKFPVKDIIEYVNNFECVIGPAGVITYVAASLKRAVIDIFKTNTDGLLYGLLGTANYCAVAGEKMSASFVWSTWENQLWPLLEASLGTSNQEKHSQTDLLQSTADSVQGRSVVN